MRRYWGHAAMLLLGISLAVGFYEGRTLVQNTTKALSAATTITTHPQSKRERRRDADREVRSAEAREPGAERERKRRPRRGTAPIAAPGEGPMMTPMAGMGGGAELVRPNRVRPRRGPIARGPTTPKVDEVLDTGLVTDGKPVEPE